MNDRYLQGKSILVTRPGGLSNYLQDSIANAYGKALHLPSMNIAPLEDALAAKQSLASLDDFDILIFVSRNAVKYASQIVADKFRHIQAKTIIAIGSGTHDELLRVGFTDVVFTDSNTGSDALLDIHELGSVSVTGKKVLIIRGVGGRELLRDKLLERGAEVQYAELYRRIKPDVEATTISKIWLEEKPDVVLVTSAEGMRNLLEMTGGKERSLFLNTRLVVISPRLKTVAESAGFRAEIKVAAGYSDDDFMLALREMFEAIENE
jgi:uroporphyrinogen-III synthase